jgi:hypothetical protein
LQLATKSRDQKSQNSISLNPLKGKRYRNQNSRKGAVREGLLLGFVDGFREKSFELKNEAKCSDFLQVLH